MLPILAGSSVAAFLSASPAWAQQDARLPDPENTWLQWAIAAGLAVVVCLAGFINAKRSHLT